MLQNVCSQVLTMLRVGWAQWKVWNPGKFLRTYSTGVNVNGGFFDPGVTKEAQGTALELVGEQRKSVLLCSQIRPEKKEAGAIPLIWANKGDRLKPDVRSRICVQECKIWTNAAASLSPEKLFSPMPLVAVLFCEQLGARLLVRGDDFVVLGDAKAVNHLHELWKTKYTVKLVAQVGRW